jgi:FkbH-like protein
MSLSTSLLWLPTDAEWRARLKALRDGGRPDENSWDKAVAISNLRLDFVGTNALDQTVRDLFGKGARPWITTKPVRLALLGSSTLTHLHSAIRVAGLRRGLWIDTYECNYGQYLQELLARDSPLAEFKPNVVLLALDAHHVTQAADVGGDRAAADAAHQEIVERLKQCWSLAKNNLGAEVIQQTLPPVYAALMGSNDHRLPGSKAAFIRSLNSSLRPLADEAGVALLALDAQVELDGLEAWYDPALWHRSKQEVKPSAAPMYGELVGRILGAMQGRSYKCLILDLDNTLWGGVIGDDGMTGIVLGQGSALGEAFVELQEYAREQSKRGIILAVCSKNDEQNAVEPFNSHPDMVLKREDIACFVANWTDKASNIKSIANTLSIGLDAMVFVDDNPVERNQVRGELPMVAVPEIPEDPALVVSVLARAGYFESLGVTNDDRNRSAQYQGNVKREILRSASGDMDSFLRGLEMQMFWRLFDGVGLQRTTQLINKTNQFNLTTRRYSEDEVAAVIADPAAFGLQLRLVDRFGDNGIIAVIICRQREECPQDWLIDTWLMSCRVLGRQVERTTLRLIVERAALLGAKRLIGEYRPTKKNKMVENHYANLGFTRTQVHDDGGNMNALEIETFAAPKTFITVTEG